MGLGTERVKDVAEMSEDAGLDEPAVKYSYELKDNLLERFGEDISCHRTGKQVVITLKQC